MNVSEAREFVTDLEEMVGYRWNAATPVAHQDQALASLRDDMRKLGVDTNDPGQMRAAFAGALCMVGPIYRTPQYRVTLARVVAILRALADWHTVKGAPGD